MIESTFGSSDAGPQDRGQLLQLTASIRLMVTLPYPSARRQWHLLVQDSLRRTATLPDLPNLSLRAEIDAALLVFQSARKPIPHRSFCHPHTNAARYLSRGQIVEICQFLSRLDGSLAG